MVNLTIIIRLHGPYMMTATCSARNILMLNSKRLKDKSISRSKNYKGILVLEMI